MQVQVEKMVTLNPKEQARLMVLNRVETVKLTGCQAAELIKVSLRHLKRLFAAYRKEGRLLWLTATGGEGHLTRLMKKSSNRCWSWHKGNMLDSIPSILPTVWRKGKE